MTYETETRCHKCARVVSDQYAHEGLRCAEWPEWSMQATSFAYLGYRIKRVSSCNWEATLGGVVVILNKLSPNDCFAAIDRLEALTED